MLCACLSCQGWHCGGLGPAQVALAGSCLPKRPPSEAAGCSLSLAFKTARMWLSATPFLAAQHRAQLMSW